MKFEYAGLFGQGREISTIVTQARLANQVFSINILDLLAYAILFNHCFYLFISSLIFVISNVFWRQVEADLADLTQLGV